MKEINDFLLGMFTCVDEFRPAFASPNLENGVVYATDAHVLIAIPESEVTLSYPTNDRYPNVSNLLKDATVDCTELTRVKVADIATELLKARIKVDTSFISCDECEGEGVVDWEYKSKSGYEHTMQEECPVCNGKGGSEKNHPFARVRLSEIEDKDGHRRGVYIGDLYFHPFHLYRLFMVALMHHYETIDIYHNPDSYGQTITNFGGIKVLAMMAFKP